MNLSHALAFCSGGHCNITKWTWFPPPSHLSLLLSFSCSQTYKHKGHGESPASSPTSKLFLPFYLLLPTVLSFVNALIIPHPTSSPPLWWLSLLSPSASPCQFITPMLHSTFLSITRIMPPHSLHFCIGFLSSFTSFLNVSVFYSFLYILCSPKFSCCSVKQTLCCCLLMSTPPTPFILFSVDGCNADFLKIQI